MIGSRRDFLKVAWSATLASSTWVKSSPDPSGPDDAIGRWSTNSLGLPEYEYSGELPAKALDRAGRDAELYPDPAFLIGNHRLTLFTHVSGVLQVITGERAWARVNAAGTINYGANRASLSVAGSEYDLVGLNSLAADSRRTRRVFGCGSAYYCYTLTPALKVHRSISVEPSMEVGAGTPAFVVSIRLENEGPSALPFHYREALSNNYVPIGMQKTPVSERIARYDSHVICHPEKRLALSMTTLRAVQFVADESVDEASKHDRKPAHVFLYAEASGYEPNGGVAASTDAELVADCKGVLEPHIPLTFRLIFGLTDGDAVQAQQHAVSLLARAKTSVLEQGLFASAWRKQLPVFAHETDESLRREMVWNAHALEAMATHSAYFGETFIPQGTIYAYEDGENISNRDNLQGLLPLCFTHPKLARSCLKFVFEQTLTTGEIKRGTAGFAYPSYSPPDVFKESDEQLYLFFALGEYLRLTGDYTLLDETVTFYPRRSGFQTTVLKMVERHFVYLRDEVGLGPNGLIRIINSDWSDSFFHQYSPDITAETAESHLNSAMALAVLPKLIAALRATGRSDVAALLNAMESYRAKLQDAYMHDLGQRDFSARAYLNDGKPSYGLDTVCLEPQGWLLQIPGLSTERKRAIFDRVAHATLTPEKVGFRIREKPIFSDVGEGEDGGIWFSIEHQMLQGVLRLDRSEGRRILRKMSFRNFAERYPGYTLGRWTNTDCMQSTLSDREGLQNYWLPTLKESGLGYCSHAHAWPLYNFCCLNEA